MPDKLSPELLARMQARAADPSGRSDISAMAASSVSVDETIDAMPESDDPAVREYLNSMNTPLAGMISNLVTGPGTQAKRLLGVLGGLIGGKQIFASIADQTISLAAKGEPRPAPPTCSEAEVAALEVALGFPLPRALRHFYVEVGNGGVGPANGIYSLKELLAKWSELTKEPIGPRGQKWPTKLLPVEGDGWNVTSIDRTSGQLIYWDVEEIDYGGWRKSFVVEAENLEAWLDKWLGKPTAVDRAKRRASRPTPQLLTDEDWRVWGEQDPLHAEYLRRLDIATMTPSGRAAIGLTESNWAEKMWDGLDLTTIKLPTPGFAKRQGPRK